MASREGESQVPKHTVACHPPASASHAPRVPARPLCRAPLPPRPPSRTSYPIAYIPIFHLSQIKLLALLEMNEAEDIHVAKKVKLETLAPTLDQLKYHSAEEAAPQAKLCALPLAPKKLKPEAIAAIFELAKYDSDDLDLLDKVHPEMLNPHVGALVAMLEEFGRQLPGDDNEEFGKALSLLRKVEPTHLENHVCELLKVMSMGLDIEWREEVESLLYDIPNVDWDLYVDEICEMLGGEDMYDHLDFLAKVSPQIRPKVVFENDEQTVFYLERRHL